MKIAATSLAAAVLALATQPQQALANAADCDQYYPNQAWSFGGNIAGPCSGNGVCDGNGRCICKDGWTGRSDFINAEGVNCQINIAAYKALWGVLAAAQVGAAIASIPYLKTRYASYVKIREMKQSRGEKYSIWDNKGSAAMLIWYSLGAPLLLIMCVVKWTLDDERVGVTWLATILFILIKFVFYVCVVLFQPSLLRAVLHGMDKSNRYVRINEYMSGVFFMLQFLISLAAIVAVVNRDSQEDVYLSYLFLMIVVSLYVSLQGLYVKRKVTATLDRSYSMSKMEKTLVMKEKLSAMQNTAIKQGAVLAFIYLLQFVWPFLWVCHDYVLPITWFIFPLMGLRTAKTSLSETETKKIERSTLSSSEEGVGSAQKATQITGPTSQTGAGSENDTDFT